MTVVPLAPMTNLALLARVHPQAFARIGRIVFMGGGVDISNATAAAEFNVFHDPEAAAMVLAACAEHDVPVTMYGLDVFYDPLVTDVQVEALRELDTPVAHLAAGLISFHHRRFANAGATIGDAGAVGILVEPDAVRTERLPVRVELDRHLDPRPHRRRPPRLGWPPRARPARPGVHDGRRRARRSTGPGSPTCGCARFGGRRHERAGAGARVAQRRPRDPGRAAPPAGGDRAR